MEQMKQFLDRRKKIKGMRNVHSEPKTPAGLLHEKKVIKMSLN
jgi:hypothetical protein